MHGERIKIVDAKQARLTQQLQEYQVQATKNESRDMVEQNV